MRDLNIQRQKTLPMTFMMALELIYKSNLQYPRKQRSNKIAYNFKVYEI